MSDAYWKNTEQYDFTCQICGAINPKERIVTFDGAKVCSEECLDKVPKIERYINKGESCIRRRIKE